MFVSSNPQFTDGFKGYVFPAGKFIFSSVLLDSISSTLLVLKNIDSTLLSAGRLNIALIAVETAEGVPSRLLHFVYAESFFFLC